MSITTKECLHSIGFKMKKIVFVLVLLFSVLGYVGAVEAQEEFTLQELSEYNGKNGNPAYIAYDGVVYDVSNHPRWKSGTHNGQKAGTDITDAIKRAPHGASKIKGLPVVGQLVK